MSSPALPVTFTFILYFFMLLIPLTLATSCGQNDYEIDDTQLNRFFFLSDKAPITEELANLQPVVDATDKILTHIALVENRIIASIHATSAPGPKDNIRPCNRKKTGFENKARMRLGIRSWPAPKFTCATDVFGTDFIQSNLPELPPPQYNVDDLFDALYNRGKVINDNLKSITRRFINNFTNPEILWNHRYETPSQKCVLHPSLAYRIGDKWYFSDEIRHQPRNRDTSVPGQQIISEYSRVVDGELGDTKRMCLPIRPKKGDIHTNRTDATTLIATTRIHRTYAPSFVLQIPMEENPAVVQSLDESDLFVQQAEDALAASSIAILVLPLVLNLIPIALLSEVSTITMLMYTLMSDVLTVFPLGIKGAELVAIGRQRYRSIFVRIAGSTNITRVDATAAEFYGAECRVHENVLQAGIVFLVLSIIFLVGGVSAEFVAQNYTRKQREFRLEELEEAGLSLLSRERDTAASVTSQGTSPPTTLGSRDLQWRETVEKSFNNGPFNDFYNTRKRGKGE